MKCKDCRYLSMARCRRNAPSTAYKRGNAVWPYVELTDWCGEFEKKAATKKKVARKKVIKGENG